MAKPNALRLTFSYKDGVVQLVSMNEVDMVVPPGNVPARADEHGFWAELYDASNNPLFRRVLHNPIPVDMEIFSDAPDKNLARVPGAPSEGAFSIVLPNHPNARAVALFSSQHEAAPRPAQPPQGLLHHLPFHALRPVPSGLAAAREVARFDLKRS